MKGEINQASGWHLNIAKKTNKNGNKFRKNETFPKYTT